MRDGESAADAGSLRPPRARRRAGIGKSIAIAAVPVAVAMAGMAMAQGPSRTAAPAGARIAVTARIAPRLNLKILDQPGELVVGASDVARGYVDVPAASRLEIVGNGPNGFLLLFDALDGPSSVLEGVHIRGLGPEVRIGPGSGMVPQPAVRGRRSIEVGYRFVLRRNVRPGAYRWPLSISAVPP